MDISRSWSDHYGTAEKCSDRTGSQYCRKAFDSDEMRGVYSTRALPQS